MASANDLRDAPGLFPNPSHRSNMEMETADSARDAAESWRSPESTRGSISKKPVDDAALRPKVANWVRKKDKAASFLFGVGGGMMVDCAEAEAGIREARASTRRWFCESLSLVLLTSLTNLTRGGLWP